MTDRKKPYARRATTKNYRKGQRPLYTRKDALRDTTLLVLVGGLFLYGVYSLLVELAKL